jgi:uncharacterized protein (DUF1330 family)
MAAGFEGVSVINCRNGGMAVKPKGGRTSAMAFATATTGSGTEEEREMAGYLIANLDITDPAKFAEYREKVVPVIEKFGGRYLVRGGEVRRVEGNLPLHRLVVLEFPTLDAAQRFYDSAEYQPLIKLRLASTRSDLVLVEGYSG